MKLSACLIVRNEATEIIGCLDTLSECDEIVVVDTGSEDNTVELVTEWANRHPDVVVVQGFFQWCDDFSAARNYAAGLASGNWILVIDADERLQPGSLDAIRAEIATTDRRTLRCRVQAQNSNHWMWAPRIYRRGVGVEWRNPIHNLLSEDSGVVVPGACIVYGYSESHQRDPDRTLRILHQEAERNPTSRTFYYLGSTLFDKGRLDEALPWFRQCVEVTTWAPERADAYLFLAKIHWQQQRGDEARKCCLYALGNVPDCREALLLMAEMSWPAQAKTWRRFAEGATNEGCIFVRGGG